MKNAPVLPPFRQGQLDGLCGIYAIINAARLVLGQTAATLNINDWYSLFGTLMYSADDHYGAANAAASGIGTKAFRKVLKSAVRHFHEEHGMRLYAGTLLPRRQRPTFLEFLDALRDTLAEPNRTVIVEIKGALSHWTVVRAISETSFQLFDSSGYDRLSIANCRLPHEAKSEARRDYIFPSKSAFVLGLR